MIQVSHSLTAVLLAAGSLILILGLRFVTALSGAALLAAVREEGYEAELAG